MRVRFLSVRGLNSRRPEVLAFVLDRGNWHRVSWKPSGWACGCHDPTCSHVDAVADLLDDRLTNEH